MLYLYRTRTKRDVRQILALTALLIVVAESGINMFNTSVWTVSRLQYLDELDDYALLYETAKGDAAARNDAVQEDADGEKVVRSEDVPFFRVEKFSRKTKNDGTLVGYPTASVFSSTMNSYVMDMYKKLGMRYSKVYYGYDGATFFTSALLNVQYMFGEDGRDEGPLYTQLADSENITLYRTESTLPFGYVAPAGYDLTSTSSNGLKLQNQMVRELGVEGTLFSKHDSEQKEDDVRFTAGEDGYYYGILTASGTKKVELSADGEIREYSDLKNNAILYLGYLEEGTVATLTNGDDEDESQKIKADIYRMDEIVLDAALNILSEESLYNVTYDSTHINGEIDMTDEGRLILSVPYEKGWTVILDGEEVTPELFGGALMGFDLESGHHTIQMHYVPHGSIAGILISIASIAIFAAIVLYGRHKRERAEVSPDKVDNDVVIKTT